MRRFQTQPWDKSIGPRFTADRDTSIDLPFRSYHKNAGDGELEEVSTALDVEDGGEADADPGLIAAMGGGQVCIEAQQGKTEPVGDGYSSW